MEDIVSKTKYRKLVYKGATYMSKEGWEKWRRAYEFASPTKQYKNK